MNPKGVSIMHISPCPAPPVKPIHKCVWISLIILVVNILVSIVLPLSTLDTNASGDEAISNAFISLLFAFIMYLIFGTTLSISGIITGVSGLNRSTKWRPLAITLITAHGIILALPVLLPMVSIIFSYFHLPYF